MADIKLDPAGRPVTTTDPNVNVAALRQAGTFVFTVVVVDDQGLSGEASLKVTVRPG